MNSLVSSNFFKKRELFEVLKVLLFDLKNIVTELESEVYSDVDAYTNKKKDYAFSSPPTNYDEVFEDDDG